MNPELDYTFEGLRHRKWVFPAFHYADGGAGAEEWYYVVGDAPFAVSFTVHTGRYPEGHTYSCAPSGNDLGWHQAGDSNDGCLALSGGSCTGDSTGIGAREWYSAQEKDADGFVPDAEVFSDLRNVYRRSKP